MNDFTRLFDIYPYQLAKYPKEKAVGIRDGKKWKTYSTQEAIENINQVSAALLELGLQSGDMVAILARGGSPWWNFLDMGMQQIGVICVPLHSTAMVEEIQLILKETEAKLCFIENDTLLKKVKSIKEGLPSLEKIFLMERGFGGEGFENYLKPTTPQILEKIEKLKAKIKHEDLATIIYTSGTTGLPKGVMLSHNNIVSNIKCILPLVPVDYQKTSFSFLPLSHVYERMVTYSWMVAGCSLYYATSVEHALDELKSVRPHYFTSVPRLLERMYEEINAAANSRNFLKRKLIRWALKVGKKFNTEKKAAIGYRIQRWFASVLVYRFWRNALGGKVKGVLVGAAPMQAELIRLFSAANIPIREGYGLTETSPVISFNRFEPGGYKVGTVGIPISGLDYKINEPDEEGRGEILVRGPNVMMGYFKNEGATKLVLDDDGWFSTGDIGQVVFRKFLKITGRKKEIFKSSDGKYIAPQKLEQLLQTSPFMEQAMILGYKRKSVSALIVPNFNNLKTWSEENNVHWTAPQFMVINQKIEALLKTEIDNFNEVLEPHERIRQYILLHELWTTDSGEMTPTLKPKRKVIESNNQKAIEKLYKD